MEADNEVNGRDNVVGEINLLFKMKIEYVDENP